MVSTYRRELWVMGSDGKLHKINRVDKSPNEQPGSTFILATGAAFVDGTGHEPKFYLEGGMPSDAGPFAPTMAASTDPGVAGIIPGVTRTNYSSSINWSTPQTIENKNLTGDAAISLRAITGPDHTIRNCYIPGLDTPYTGTAQGGVIDCRSASVARLNLEHLTISPTYPNDRWDGIYGHDFTAYRVLIQRTVDAFAALNPYSPNLNVSLQGCWAGNLSWYKSDRGVHPDGTHNDWLQHHTGLYLEILGCTIWGYKWNTLNPTNVAGAGNGDLLVYTPTDDGTPNPQIGQGILAQTEAYFHIGNHNVDGLFLYGGNHPIKFASKCGVSGHSHRYNHNPTIKNVLYMNSDHKDYGGSLHYYPIRTDNAMTINGMGPFATTGQTLCPADWNIKYANNSSANRLYNVETSRRGTSVPIRCDVVV